MASKTDVNQSPVSPDLLEILRDPQAIQEGAKHGADPGRLEPVRSGYCSSEVSLTPAGGPDYRVLIAAGAIILFLLVIVGLGRKRSSPGADLPPAG